MSLVMEDSQKTGGPTMIVVRVATGIRSHFDVRATEWLMVYPALGISIALLYQHSMFSTSPSFQVVSQYWSETQWAVIGLLVVLVRLVALTVNGTFARFKYSPHMRLTASVIGLFFWSQFTLGFAIAALTGNGAWSAPIAYSTVCLAELLNINRSWTDIARGR